MVSTKAKWIGGLGGGLEALAFCHFILFFWHFSAYRRFLRDFFWYYLVCIAACFCGYGWGLLSLGMDMDMDMDMGFWTPSQE